MLYDPAAAEKYTIFPDQVKQVSPYYVKDKYHIKIEYKKDLFVPKVYETGKRLERFSVRSKIPMGDLHVNPRGDLCLCPKAVEKIKLTANYTVVELLTILVIPFFYAQSYFEKNGHWAWKDYSHGDPGILECFAETINQISNKKTLVLETINSLMKRNQDIIHSSEEITRQTLCFCGSKDKFRHCHHEAWMAAKLLKQHIQLNS